MSVEVQWGRLVDEEARVKGALANRCELNQI